MHNVPLLYLIPVLFFPRKVLVLLLKDPMRTSSQFLVLVLDFNVLILRPSDLILVLVLEL